MSSKNSMQLNDSGVMPSKFAVKLLNNSQIIVRQVFSKVHNLIVKLEGHIDCLFIVVQPVVEDVVVVGTHLHYLAQSYIFWLLTVHRELISWLNDKFCFELFIVKRIGDSNRVATWFDKARPDIMVTSFNCRTIHDEAGRLVHFLSITAISQSSDYEIVQIHVQFVCKCVFLCKH